MFEILAILLLILASAIYAGGEMGIYCLNRIRLRRLAQEGAPGARRLERLLQHRQSLIATMLGALNLARYAVSALATFWFEKLRVMHPDLAAAFALTPVTLILGEVIPKNLFALRANSLMCFFAPVMSATRVLIWPLTIALQGIMWLSSLVFRGREADALGVLSTARLRYFLGEGHREGTITAQQERIAHNIMGLKQVAVERVMTPLAAVDMISHDITPEELKLRAAGTRFSRLPVYEGQRENIVGIFVLLRYLAAADDAAAPPAMMDFAHRPLRIAARLSADEALLRMRRERLRMAVVEDEQGRAAGIVTIKDLVEEVVGELREW